MNDQEKICTEVAEAEFDRWGEAMDLDFDESFMDEDEKKAFQRQKRRVVREIQLGSLVVNDKGEAVFTPRNPASGYRDPITFHERTGATLMSVDRHKKGQDAARSYAMMADMCRLSQKVFAGLVGNDVKVCEALYALLMD
jgi:hypothetical protein